MPFGQLVIGSPGSGKTTYCHGIQQFLTALGRPVQVVNLDPANHKVPYPCAISLSSLITVKDVMAEFKLGPNGAMLYCMEYLEANLDWLCSELDKLGRDAYVIFDLPGQVELSTNHGSLRRIVDKLQKRDWRLVAVHLMDAHHITDASRYVSLLLLSLRAMLTLELPHINVLSKVDLLGDGADLAFNLDYYTEVQDLSYLQHELEKQQGKRSSRFGELNRAICDLVEDFGLVSFETLAVEDKKSMFRLLRTLDKATGYVYVASDRAAGGDAGGTGASASGPRDPNEPPLPDPDDPELAAYEPGSAAATAAIAASRSGTAASAAALFSVADSGAPAGWGSALEVQERWIDHRDEFDRYEREVEWPQEGERAQEERIREEAKKHVQ